jgi:hypothetical protein
MQKESKKQSNDKLSVENIIHTHFNEQKQADKYVLNRLQHQFDKAPPTLVHRHMEQYATDILEQISVKIEDKKRISIACLEALKKLSKPQKSYSLKNLIALSELSYFVLQLAKNNPNAYFNAEQKKEWAKELSNLNLEEETISTNKDKNNRLKNLIEVVYIFEILLSVKLSFNWDNLRNKICEFHENADEYILELLFMACQYTTNWNQESMSILLEWSTEQKKLPNNFYEQFFLNYLLKCKRETSEANKTKQNDFITHILTSSRFFNTLDKQKKTILCESLLKASRLFESKSFKILNDERIKYLENTLEKWKKSTQEKVHIETSETNNDLMQKTYSKFSPSTTSAVT